MLKHILNSFWFDFQQFTHFMAYIIGFVICGVITFVNVLMHNAALGLVVGALAVFSAIAALKMYGEGLDDSHHDLYITYLLVSEIFSGSIFIHLAWWIFKIPLTVIEYRKDSQ